MKILQFNCTSIRNKVTNLEQYLHLNEICIGCLSETFLSPQENLKIKNYEILRSDRASNKGGGVAISVKKDLDFKKFSFISRFGSIEVCACEVASSSGDLAIFSFYILPRSNFTASALNNILSITSCRSIVLCGDFNAHNVSWGSRETDLRSRILMKFIDDNYLFLLNTGIPTYIGSSLSCIDVSLCSTNLGLIRKE